jgi:hypothetical protein
VAGERAGVANGLTVEAGSPAHGGTWRECGSEAVE